MRFLGGCYGAIVLVVFAEANIKNNIEVGKNKFAIYCNVIMTKSDLHGGCIIKVCVLDSSSWLMNYTVAHV